jgi:hypothetical protein
MRVEKAREGGGGISFTHVASCRRKKMSAAATIATIMVVLLFRRVLKKLELSEARFDSDSSQNFNARSLSTTSLGARRRLELAFFGALIVQSRVALPCVAASSFEPGTNRVMESANHTVTFVNNPSPRRERPSLHPRVALCKHAQTLHGVVEPGQILFITATQYCFSTTPQASEAQTCQKKIEKSEEKRVFIES